MDVIDLVATDDDSGTPTSHYYNSLITITLQPGNYVAIVGDYYLSVPEAVSGVISNDYTGTVSINFLSDKAIILQNTNAKGMSFKISLLHLLNSYLTKILTDTLHLNLCSS